MHRSILLFLVLSSSLHTNSLLIQFKASVAKNDFDNAFRILEDHLESNNEESKENSNKLFSYYYFHRSLYVSTPPYNKLCHNVMIVFVWDAQRSNPWSSRLVPQPPSLMTKMQRSSGPRHPHAEPLSMGSTAFWSSGRWTDRVHDSIILTCQGSM